MTVLVAPNQDPTKLPPGAIVPNVATPAPAPTAPAAGTYTTNPGTGINDFTPTPAPINRTVVAPSADAASSFLDTFTPPQSEADIAEQKRQAAQGLIDSTNKVYDDQVRQEQQAGQDRLNKNNSVSVLSGLMGSTEAVRTDNEVSAANQKNVDAINNQRGAALAGIYTKISNDAATEAEQQKQDATKSAEDILARRTQAQTDAVNNLKLMASSGAVDFEAFKNNPQNAQVYNYALQAFGGSEDALKGFMALNKPQDTILSQGIAPDGHTYYTVSKNPMTGQTSTDHFDLGFTVPQGSDHITLPNGDLMFTPKNGIDPSKPIDGQVQIYKGGSDPLKQLQMQSLQLDIKKKQSDLNGTSSVDPTTVAGWVQNIKSGAAKLSDISGDPSLKNAVSTALSQGGSSQSDILKTTQQSLQELNDMVTNNQGFSGAVGAKGFSSFFGLRATPLPGTAAADFDAKLQQAKNDVILPNLTLLHGLGRVTDREFQALTSAVTSLSTNESEGQFKKDLKTLTETINAKMQETSSTGTSSSDLASQVAAKGYDYQAMKADGHSDADIKAALGL